MAVFINEETRVVVQGLTGREGKFHALRNRDYGTKVVAGTRPGKGGEEVEGIPIFNTVVDAVKETGANTAMTFVPPASTTVLKIGIPSTSSPPLPGLVPATTFVP